MNYEGIATGFDTINEIGNTRIALRAISNARGSLMDLRCVIITFSRTENGSSDLLCKLLMHRDGDWHLANYTNSITSKWLKKRLRPMRSE